MVRKPSDNVAGLDIKFVNYLEMLVVLFSVLIL
jgi:hypothetical protein